MEKNTEMPFTFVDVTDRELMNNYYSLVHCFSKFSSHYLLSFFEDRNSKYLCL